jgi:hypothetical protein
MDEIKNPPFRITVEHWDEKITLELDHSDITFDEYIEMFRKLSNAVFTTGTVNEFFEGKE